MRLTATGFKYGPTNAGAIMRDGKRIVFVAGSTGPEFDNEVMVAAIKQRRPRADRRFRSRSARVRESSAHGFPVRRG